MEELMRILGELHPDVDFNTADDLIGDGVLDSLDIVTLITEINSAYDVSIPAEEILPEGNLTQSVKTSDSPSAILSITSSENQTLYLRGFVGDSYENGTWTKPDGEDGDAIRINPVSAVRGGDVAVVLRNAPRAAVVDSVGGKLCVLFPCGSRIRPLHPLDNGGDVYHRSSDATGDRPRNGISRRRRRGA